MVKVKKTKETLIICYKLKCKSLFFNSIVSLIVFSVR